MKPRLGWAELFCFRPLFQSLSLTSVTYIFVVIEQNLIMYSRLTDLWTLLTLRLRQQPRPAGGVLPDLINV